MPVLGPWQHRAALTAALLVLLPAAGVLWALGATPLLRGLAVALGLACACMALLEEALAGAAEAEAKRLAALASAQAERIAALTEAARERERILSMLEEQNSRISAELIARASHTEAA